MIRFLAGASLALLSADCLAVDSTFHIPDSGVSVTYSHATAPSEFSGDAKASSFLYLATIHEKGDDKQWTRVGILAVATPGVSAEDCKRTQFDGDFESDAKVDRSSIATRVLPDRIQVDYLQTGELNGAPVKSTHSAAIIYREGYCVMAHLARFPNRDEDRAVMDRIAASIRVTKSE